MAKYSKMEQALREYEDKDKTRLPAEEYVLLRIDGRAFHTYTRNLKRPYDSDLMEAMRRTSQALVEGMQGVRLAYTQSDEISLLITGWKNESQETAPSIQFGGVARKLISISASIATAAFNQTRLDQECLLGDYEHPKLATFDSRVWSFSQTKEGRQLVIEYFMNRRADCLRNSVQMAARARFPHKALQGVPVVTLKEMLRKAGHPWEDEPDNFKYGTLLHSAKGPLQDITRTDSRTGEIETTAVRRNVILSEPLLKSEQVNSQVPQLIREN